MATAIRQLVLRQVGIAPLVVFRIAFGTLMFLSTLRFVLRGWVHDMFVAPKIHFPYFGFEWVKPLGQTGMYMVFALMMLACIFIVGGFLYRISTTAFFLLFTYVELIDKTNYLNHYYFVSLVSFILIFLPAAKRFSLDNRLFSRGETLTCSRGYILILQLQMFIVYFFAGVAKINYDWLAEAQPLRTWLPAFSHLPLIGEYMESSWVAFAFSWFGCIYDLAIGFLLFNRRTVKLAYVLVVIFHLATALFFNIGMFPYIMMTITIIFFGENFHERILSFFRQPARSSHPVRAAYIPAMTAKVFAVFLLIQIALPFRFLLYSGDLFWTEQGYRFSWRVMLMEKAGTAFFSVRDGQSEKRSIIDNKEYLTYMQEKMMATQPDMMVDYARFLKEEYKRKGYRNPVVTVESYVTVNGSGTREFVDPAIDLSIQSNSFLADKTWVRSY